MSSLSAPTLQAIVRMSEQPKSVLASLSVEERRELIRRAAEVNENLGNTEELDTDD